MATAKELKDELSRIFKTQWTDREGQKVPESEDINLGNYSVKLEGTVLYADLKASTELVGQYKDFFAAEIYKAYLLASCRAIRDNGGEITAFDGDRVMAVYIGNRKNSAAAKTALQINWAVQNLINPAIKEHYKDTPYQVRQAVGIDTSQLFVARTGIRGSNDLVWVGRAANYAAKLSSLRDEDYPVFITEQVFKKLDDSSKYGGDPRSLMWQRSTWQEMGVPIYRSNWSWSID